MSKFSNSNNRIDKLAALPEQIPVTDDVILRRIYPEDAERFSDIIERNPEIRNYVAWAKEVYSSEDVLTRLQRCTNEEMLGRFAIDADEEIVGYAGILPGNQNREYGVSYFLDSSTRGKGYAKRAIAALVDQAATKLEAEHIYSQIIIGNDASAAVVRSLGFLPAEKLIGVDFPVEQQRYRLELNTID
jgi:RimJ/RimL family protein N-acetyltransferase